MAGRSAVCVFAVSRDALPLRTGATVAGSVGNVELTATLFKLLLILWLGQRIVQVTLHFNTLLTIRCHLGFALEPR